MLFTKLKKKLSLLFVIFFSLTINATVSEINFYKTLQNPCEKTTGTVNIIEGNKAYTSYKNALKQLANAEKFLKMGDTDMATNNLKNVNKYLVMVLQKEPNANLSEICSQLKKLTSTNKTTSVNTAELSTYATNVQQFLYNYEAYVTGMYANNAYKDKEALFIEMKNFPREKLNTFINTSGLANTNGSILVLKQQLQNFDALLQQSNIVNKLTGMLDELNDAAATDLADRSKRTIDVVKGFYAISGNNPKLKPVFDYANRQLQKANIEMESVFTSDFHKENVNKIIFTKKPYEIGKEHTVEINPIFSTGDAIYATLYLKGKIAETLEQNGTASLKVQDENGNLLDRWFEKWEVENYTNASVVVNEDVDKSLTYYQFVLIPNLSSNLKNTLANKNITPIHMARGASKQSPRKITYTVNVSSFNRKNLSNEMYGKFTFDFTKGNPKEYYTKVDNQFIEVLIADEELPKAAQKNPSLESTLLGEMKSQNYQEQYKRAIIVSEWELIKPTDETPFKRIRAAFPYKLPDGKCGYQVYTFKSFKTGNGGWTTLKKFGGTDAANRIPCHKI